MNLAAFVRESNRIEGIKRLPTNDEVTAHEVFLGTERMSVPAIERFVKAVCGEPLRKRRGMDVTVGDYVPPLGGPDVLLGLRLLVDDLNLAVAGKAPLSPFEVHVRYERLHPFMDGNGRSGRALWAWHSLKIDRDPLALGFLHTFYYEALAQCLSRDRLFH